MDGAIPVVVCSASFQCGALPESFTATYICPQLYAWKDYTDTLYVTVSLNATGFGTFGALSADAGQFLHTSPSIFNSLPSGQLTLWSTFIANQTGLPNYLSTDMLTSTLSSWSSAGPT